jgi:hypothetical protein
VNWSLLAHSMVQCQALANTVMKIEIPETWGAQILGTRSPGQLNFVCWHLICLGPEYGTCFIKQFQHLEL